jgi:hypothetical protein
MRDGLLAESLLEYRKPRQYVTEYSIMKEHMASRLPPLVTAPSLLLYSRGVQVYLRMVIEIFVEEVYWRIKNRAHIKGEDGLNSQSSS